MFGLRKILHPLVPHFVTAICVHYRYHGVFPNLLNPQTMNEKICYRKIFDRRPILTQFQDKYAVRHYVETKLGADILPKRYHVTEIPSDIPFDRLPEKFVVKPTHGSGWIWFVDDKSKLDRQALIDKCNEWLSQSYFLLMREWPYKHIHPRIVIDEFIESETGDALIDYKFYVFNGVVRLIQAHQDRFTRHRVSFHKPSWERFQVVEPANECKLSENVAAPKFLKEMIGVAETLSDGIDFVRVDLFESKKQIYFGEMTTTPANGMLKYEPADFDRYLGQFWKIDSRAKGAGLLL